MIQQIVYFKVFARALQGAQCFLCFFFAVHAASSACLLVLSIVPWACRLYEAVQQAAE
jgi:hypothetical protein